MSTVTVPPWRSLTWRAISRALRSSGLKMAVRAPRFIVPSLVIASPVMLWVSGTCLTSTMLSIGLESVIGVSGDRRPAPAAGCRGLRTVDAFRAAAGVPASGAFRGRIPAGGVGSYASPGRTNGTGAPTRLGARWDT